MGIHARPLPRGKCGKRISVGSATIQSCLATGIKDQTHAAFVEVMQESPAAAAISPNDYRRLKLKGEPKWRSNVLPAHRSVKLKSHDITDEKRRPIERSTPVNLLTRRHSAASSRLAAFGDLAFEPILDLGLNPTDSLSAERYGARKRWVVLSRALGIRG